MNPLCRSFLTVSSFRTFKKITVIPMIKPVIPTETQIHPHLPLLQNVKNLDREGLVNALRATRQFSDLDNDYWQALFEQGSLICRTLLPSDIASIFCSMYRSKRRNMEFVQQLNQHLRRIEAAATLSDIARIFSVYQEMGWRSKDTIRRLTKRFMAGIDSADVWQIRDVVSVYPRLHVRVCEDSQNVLFKKAGDRLVRIVRKIKPKDFAVILNSFVRSEQRHEQLFDVASQHISTMVDKCSTTQLAIIANSYARADSRKLALLRAISIEGLKRKPELKPQDISLILNSFAKLEYMDLIFYNDIAPVICDNIPSFSPQSIANIANSYGKMGVRNEVLFGRISKMSMHLITKFSAQELGILANSFSRLEFRDKSLFGSISDEVIYRGTIARNFEIYKFDMKSLEQLSNAFAKLGFRDRRFFFVVVLLMKKCVHKGGNKSLANSGIDGQSVSTLIHAFGKARMKMASFFSFITFQILKHKHCYSTASLTNIINGCYLLGIKNRPVFAAITKNAKERLEQFSPVSLVILLKVFGKLELYKRSFMRRSLKQCGLYLAQFDCHALCTLADALADTRYRDVSFLERLGKAIMSRRYDMSLHHVSVTLSAFARLRIDDKIMYDTLLKIVFEKQHELQATDMLSACHSLALLETYEWDPEVLYSLLRSLMQCRNNMHISGVKLLQGLELYLRLLKPKIYDDMPYVLKDFLRRTRKVNIGTHDYMARSSYTHKDIASTFLKVGLPHRSEVRLGPYSLDIVVGMRTVIEVDGQTHFYRETEMRTAKALLKHNILQAMGWNVLHIPYQEWDQCSTKYRKMLYCASFWKNIVHASTTHTKLGATFSTPTPPTNASLDQ